MFRGRSKMMKVKFKFFGPFREATKMKEIEITITEESKILDVLNFLIEKYGEKMRKILFDPETTSLRVGPQILVNGRNIHVLNGVNTFLKDGDLVTTYPPVAGG
jgi:molybdopterin synthase sulfur carrier subunit